MLKYNKHAFFFRTRQQFEKAEAYVDVLNELAVSKYCIVRQSFFAPACVGWYCQHRTEPQWRKVPKKNPTNKKYEFILRILPHLEEKLEEDFVAHLESLGFEKKPTENNSPKYTEDDLTKVRYRLDTVAQFKKLCKMLNKDYGNGNWHLRGQRKVLRKLHEIEGMRMHPNLMPRSRLITQEHVDNGIIVDVCVVGDAPTLERKLFKLELMK